MPVGAGSIRRVAKVAGAEVAKDTAPATKTKKPTAKNNNIKTNSTITKAVEASARTAEYNKVCHITEELPIYLL